MKIFKLPDLGEGLPDAQIREWYIKVGDTVKTDQPMVAMETAKALVDVPAPFDGVVEKLFGNAGDTIETGHPLIGFVGESSTEDKPKDAGTVVGAIEESDVVLQESATGVVSQQSAKRVKATPAVRLLAKELGVDLETITPKGEMITIEDVKSAVQIGNKTSDTTPKATPAAGFETLSPAKRAMVLSMSKARDEIAPVTLVDDADLHTWEPGQDLMVRLVRAISAACAKEPTLNSHFDSASMTYKPFKEINMGLAVDAPSGLFVPVIKNAAQKSNQELREQINRFKQQAKDRSIPQEDLKDATLMLSNFGAFAGRYANPVLTPPMVTIIGIGRTRQEVVAFNNEIVIHPILPISLTCDHRLVTGGEMARFLRALIDELAKSN